MLRNRHAPLTYGGWEVIPAVATVLVLPDHWTVVTDVYETLQGEAISCTLPLLLHHRMSFIQRKALWKGMDFAL